MVVRQFQARVARHSHLAQRMRQHTSTEHEAEKGGGEAHGWVPGMVSQQK